MTAQQVGSYSERPARNPVWLDNRERQAVSRFLAAAVSAATILSGDILAVLITRLLSLNLDSKIDQTLARAFTSICTLDLSWHGWGTLLVVSGLLLHLNARGHYSLRSPIWAEFGDVLRALCLALLCDFFLVSVLYGERYTLKSAILWVVLVPVLMLLRCSARCALNWAGLWSRRTLIVGAANLLENVRIAIESERALGYQLVGVVTLESFRNQSVSVIDLAARAGIDFVVLALGGAEAEAERDLVATVIQLGIPFAIAPRQGSFPISGLRSQYFLTHDVLFLITRNRSLLPLNRAIKYMTDFITALALLIFLSPVMLVIAMLVAKDGGPVLFLHERIGRHGKRFGCVKFRTMIINAKEVLQAHIEGNPAAREEWDATQKLSRDPRVTRLGGFLRRNSLDELPQLFNILRGEMSLVGPRPIVSAEIPRYGSDISYYYETRPGMTGLWQVSGRSDVSYERRVHLDAWYVRNWTQSHDLAILLKTLPAVLLRRGAV
jgi:Undecaprenyl-phosphate galactose phosphotransferase WbaP